MVTRIYEWDKNETWWTWIEVTDNKVINLILRSLNNLIKVNDNNEVYTDLQLEDWIENSDTLPIWVNVGRVLAADGRPATWTLISGQTTSWDRVKVLYGDNGNIYTDNGTWTWNILWTNVKAFYLSSTSDLEIAQEIYNWYIAWKYPIIYFEGNLYLFVKISWDNEYLRFYNPCFGTQTGTTQSFINFNYMLLRISNGTIIDIRTEQYVMGDFFLSTNKDYTIPYIPQYAGSPATKKYVDNRVVISDTEPETPSVWQFWYNTQSSVLRLYDGTQRLSI